MSGRGEPSRVPSPRPTGRRALALLVGGLLLIGGAAACGKDDAGSPSGGGAKMKTPEAGIELTVTPADKATGVPVSVEIEAKAKDGKVTEMSLADAAGKAVDGELRADGSSWVPAEPLDYTTTYTVTVTVDPAKGDTTKASTTFTTMKRPSKRMPAHVYMADDMVYGQAMPIVVELGGGGVPEQHRAAVERRLFVTSEPQQEGVWHWDSGTQVEYRPKEYWQPGTKLSVRLGLGGLPIGDGRYGQVDITIKASIDTVRREIVVTNSNKQLVATQDGRTVKTMPVSLGKPSKPSFSGTMVIMERLATTVFDSSTYGVPADSAGGYRTKVKYAERLTWDGQFIHAAPWSVADQGHRNVSHGCVNVATNNAKWVYDWVKIGDPVVVKGTGHELSQGNGWTAWSLPWDDFAAGSALR